MEPGRGVKQKYRASTRQTIIPVSMLYSCGAFTPSFPGKPIRHLLRPIKPLAGLALILLAMAGKLIAAPEAPPAGAADRIGLAEATKRHAVLYAPHPTYPYDARVRHQIGSGVAQVQVDENTGLVQSVVMSPGTGSTILDQETIKTLLRWKVQPHTLTKLRVPISYSLAGVSFTLDKREQSLVEMLTPYLGSGTLRKAPAPTYPVPQSWGYKHGKGVYELQVDPSGRVTDVKVLQSSGDAIFDKTVRKTLLKWQLTRGPLVVEIPLRFVLTPNSYRLDVAR
ncbi:MAG: TonB family protein [Chthoniobacterales bacterium]|nr:TonB family protein [Chthoniobacterales bacterium]